MENLLSVSQVAAICHATPQTVRRHIMSGALPGKMIGGRYHVLADLLPFDPSKKLYTLSAAAKELQVHRKTIENWMGLGYIVPIRLGRTVYFPQSEIDAILGDRPYPHKKAVAL